MGVSLGSGLGAVSLHLLDSRGVRTPSRRDPRRQTISKICITVKERARATRECDGEQSAKPKPRDVWTARVTPVLTTQRATGQLAA